MANPGYVVPVGIQNKEGFHALRRTTEGLLYYTKVNKDSGESLDYEGGSPTDLNGNKQISDKTEYVEEDTVLQSGTTQIFTGDGSTATFTLTTPVVVIKLTAPLLSSPTTLIVVVVVLSLLCTVIPVTPDNVPLPLPINT